MRRHGRQPERGMTMPEALMALAITIVMVSIAIPMLRSRYASTEGARIFAEQVARDLRRARTLAIMNASTSPQGYAVEVTAASGSQLRAYRTVDLTSLAVVQPTRTLPTGSGGVRWESSGNVRKVEFSPLGSATVYDVNDQPVVADPLATVSSSTETYQIRLTQASGFVEVQRVP